MGVFVSVRHIRQDCPKLSSGLQRIMVMRDRSKAVGPMSQICGTLKNPTITFKSGRLGKIQSAISHPSFANRGLRSSSSGSGLSHERAARSGTAWAPLELTEDTNTSGAQKGPSNNGLSAHGVTQSQANLSIYL
jgi:hypothetical protein